ncbi:unnamed protein product [Urochloa humidicola]
MTGRDSRAPIHGEGEDGRWRRRREERPSLLRLAPCASYCTPASSSFVAPDAVRLGDSCPWMPCGGEGGARVSSETPTAAPSTAEHSHGATRAGEETPALRLVSRHCHGSRIFWMSTYRRRPYSSLPILSGMELCIGNRVLGNSTSWNFPWGISVWSCRRSYWRRTGSGGGSAAACLSSRHMLGAGTRRRCCSNHPYPPHCDHAARASSVFMREGEAGSYCSRLCSGSRLPSCLGSSSCCTEEPLHAMVRHDSGPFTAGTESTMRKRWIFALCPLISVGGYVIYLIALVLDNQHAGIC